MKLEKKKKVESQEDPLTKTEEDPLTKTVEEIRFVYDTEYSRPSSDFYGILKNHKR